MIIPFLSLIHVSLSNNLLTLLPVIPAYPAYPAYRQAGGRQAAGRRQAGGRQAAGRRQAGGRQAPSTYANNLLGKLADCAFLFSCFHAIILPSIL